MYQVCLVLDYYSSGCAKQGSIQYMCDRADGVGCPHPPNGNGVASFDDFDEQHEFDPLSILPGDDSIFGVPPTCDEFNPTYKVACQDALNGYRMCHYGRAEDTLEFILRDGFDDSTNSLMFPNESGMYNDCSDLGKAFNCPIFHCNGDDPLAVATALEMAVEWRHEWGGDVIIDMVCYRQNGHNELDQPAFT